MAGTVRLIVDGAAQAAVLRGPDGPVMRSLTRAADEVIVGARKYINDRRRYPARATHRLERTIVKRPTAGPTGPGMMVVAGIGLTPGYAEWAHEGNAPPGSVIRPKRAAFLVFSPDGQRVIRTRQVKASTPNPYLRDAMNDVVRVRFGGR